MGAIMLPSQCNHRNRINSHVFPLGKIKMLHYATQHAFQFDTSPKVRQNKSLEEDIKLNYSSLHYWTKIVLHLSNQN